MAVRSPAAALLLSFGLMCAAQPAAAETAAAEPPTPAATSAPKAKPVRTTTRTRADSVTTGALGPVRDPVPFKPGQDLINWYSEMGGLSLPRGTRLVYCHGFGCKLRTVVSLTDADDKALAAIFSARQGSAASEREGIDLAVQWWEKRAAPLLGGPLDIRGSEQWQANSPGQTDCLDEATNSTTILVHLQSRGLLRHHRVIRPESRGGFLYAHATAVFEEVGGQTWVVDSWMRDSGDPNDVMPLDEWLSKT